MENLLNSNWNPVFENYLNILLQEIDSDFSKYCSSYTNF
jgi:hypothetical protein